MARNGSRVQSAGRRAKPAGCIFPSFPVRAGNGPRILKDCGPGLLAKKDLNRSLGPVLQIANIKAQNCIEMHKS